jgi:putative transposase
MPILRRGNYWDNAVAESFFSSLKKKRMRKQIYRTRRHSYLGGVSPEAFERVSQIGL